MTDLAASRVAAERYLGWGRLAAGASLLVSLAAGVIGGYAWFEAAAATGGVVLVALGLSTLLGAAADRPIPTRLVRVVRRDRGVRRAPWEPTRTPGTCWSWRC